MKVMNVRKDRGKGYEPKEETFNIYRSLLIKLQTDKNKKETGCK